MSWGDCWAAIPQDIKTDGAFTPPEPLFNNVKNYWKLQVSDSNCL